MVDFRYHLVSLISVFLALAVGIVLGAGPLRDTISDQLTGQVEILREEKEALRVELEAAQATRNNDQAFIAAAGPALLEGALPEHRVAVVRLPGVTDAEATAVLERVTEAGAAITADVALTDLWALPEQSALRGQVADTLKAIVVPSGDETAEQRLARALHLALVDADPLDPRVTSNSAGTVIDALTTGTEPLMTVQGDLAPADLVLVLTPTTAVVDGEPQPEGEADLVAGWASVVHELGLAGDTVAAGSAASDRDVLVVVRNQGATTTVDGVATLVGQVTVPLALAAEAAGLEPRAYGFGLGAQAPLPENVELTIPDALVPPEEPTAPESTEPAEGATAPTDGATTEPADGEAVTTDAP